MIIVDSALRERERSGRPVRVGVVGAGFMSRSIVRQVTRFVPGMEVAVVASRRLATAGEVYTAAGVHETVTVDSASELERRIGKTACITDDPSVVWEADGIDAIVEVTGSVEFGARVATAALSHGKHVVVNAELDATVGAVLRRRADEVALVVTNIDGDQPAVQMNLYRFAVSMGMKPLLCGNVKSLMDHYRTPETQRGFAAQWDQSPEMVTSFADGTKISFEQAVIGNATGMGVARRGMIGFRYDGRLDDPEHLACYSLEDLEAWGGIVDYVLGAKPGGGVFVLATHDPAERKILDFYKMGAGPLYCLYAPYHLGHYEAPLAVARAVLFHDAAVASRPTPTVAVVATAKRDLRAGEVVDGLGGFMTYGQCENVDVALRESLLPMGVAEGCRLVRDVPQDAVITYDDVDLPAGRLVDRLLAEQRAVSAPSLERA